MQRLLPVMLVALAAPLAAQPAPLDQLLKNSPFGAPRPGSPGETTGQAWEFRGLVEENGVLWFSLYETSSRRSAWRRLQQPDEQLVVRQYDANGNTLTIEFQSRTLVLPLRSAPRTEGSPVAPQLPPGAQPAVAANATPAAPADNAQRLQQIAEEIRRRRALRQQTLQNTQNNPPAARP